MGRQSQGEAATFSGKEPIEKSRSQSQGQKQGLNRIVQRVGKHSTTEQLLVVCRQNTEGMMDGLRKVVDGDEKNSLRCVETPGVFISDLFWVV